MSGAPEPDRMVGLVLGGAYQLVGRVAEGGMGAVYEAHHLRMQKRVAVKVLPRSNTRHPDALERFQREAMIASRLGHPHLVNVIDFGTSEDNEPYLVMEFLEGEDLERRLGRANRMPLQTVVQIVRQAASAVAAVHAKGVVHRDLKPANIFLVQVPGEPDFVKVLDFGVSKIRAAHTKLTDASRTIGTPEYMSPEQAAGLRDEVDHRTDQWALACIVWEMLSGRAPFSADDTSAIFFQLTNLPPPSLSKSAPNLPAGIEPVLMRALSKNPADRYPSIRAFARTLETAVVGSWAEITPMAAEVTRIATFSEIVNARRAVSLVRAFLGLDRVVAAIKSRTARLGRRRKVALMLVAVVLSAGTSAPFLVGRRHDANAAQPNVASVPGESTTNRRSDDATKPLAMPSDRPSPREWMGSELRGGRQSPGVSSVRRKAKGPSRVAKVGKSVRTPDIGRRHMRLTVDDF
jgi:tRNA A-37 threonylcarbamoyl transferase component Bud32